MGRHEPADRQQAGMEHSAFASDVIEGLRRPQKAIPAKYFYDAEGSRLFDLICTLPEYYPTRTETGILREGASRIAALAGPDVALVEFGSGSSEKVRILLDALENPRAYVPIDISVQHMLAAADALRADYPGLDVLPLAGDFTQPIILPRQIGTARPLGFFPGSTIGNLTPNEARSFLAQARETLGEEALFVLGVDLKKDVAVLEAAYNDAQGITAAFNLNLLRRIGRELGGDIDVDGFRHRAVYNAEQSRIEMHLESLGPQAIRVAGLEFTFEAGETIHTENSYKYAPDEVTAVAAGAGWKTAEVLTDSEAMFGVFCLRAG
ncbi:L-histidine N(alpha)-methyltransferase [Terrihabitans sp. B22-R8]|uniref:L-histidine N(alpha)-methyltransferase n=1 Tax=Terrihabitans sp. B22-R8 TaxID=3425128 RepID=UPI00403D10D4